MGRRKRVTLRDLADELQLSVQTVSKALRGKSGMSEQTRRDVMETARKMGYWTKDQERSLGFDRIAPYPVMKRRFLLMNNELSLNFNRLLLQGLHERFIEFGHTVQPLLIPPDLRPQSFADWSESQGIPYVDGIFIAPRMGEWEQRLLKLPMPRILLNFPPPEAKVDSVIWDVYDAVFQSVRHLSALGHRNIMYVGDIDSQRGFVLRWQAFREAMKEAGAEVDPELHCTVRGHEGAWIETFKSLYECTRPTAVLIAIEEQAEPVFRALGEIGVSVPQQCSVVACLNEQSDHLPLCSRPLLSIRESGYRAADRMLWRIANPTRPYEHIRISGDFMKGMTSQALDSSTIDQGGV